MTTWTTGTTGLTGTSWEINTKGQEGEKGTQISRDPNIKGPKHTKRAAKDDLKRGKNGQKGKQIPNGNRYQAYIGPTYGRNIGIERANCGV
jgi:hypothetical protein